MRSQETSYESLHDVIIIQISKYDGQLQNERQVFVMLFFVLVLKDKCQKTELNNFPFVV